MICYTRRTEEALVSGLHAGKLVENNLDCVRRMVSQEVADLDKQCVVRKRIDAAIEYMKLYSFRHIGADADGTHDTVRALHCGADRSTCVMTFHCNSCFLPFHVLTDVEKAMVSALYNALESLCHAKDSLKLYMTTCIGL